MATKSFIDPHSGYRNFVSQREQANGNMQVTVKFRVSPKGPLHADSCTWVQGEGWVDGDRPFGSQEKIIEGLLGLS
jgi:hypothetical protein